MRCLLVLQGLGLLLLAAACGGSGGDDLFGAPAGAGGLAGQAGGGAAGQGSAGKNTAGAGSKGGAPQAGAGGSPEGGGGEPGGGEPGGGEPGGGEPGGGDQGGAGGEPGGGDQGGAGGEAGGEVGGGGGEPGGGEPGGAGGGEPGGSPQGGAGGDPVGGAGTTGNECASLPGAKYNPQSGHCYWVISGGILGTDWAGRQNACANQGGHLVSITTPEENAFVQLLHKGEVWIGASDGKSPQDATKGVYGWVTQEPFDYASWAPNEPNMSQTPAGCIPVIGKCYEHCATQKQDGQWNDRGCAEGLDAICEQG